MSEMKRFDILFYNYKIKGEAILLELKSIDGDKVLLLFSKEENFNIIPKLNDEYILTIHKNLEYFTLIRDMLTTEKPVYITWSTDEASNTTWSIGTEDELQGVYDEDYEDNEFDSTTLFDEIIMYLSKMDLYPQIAEDRLIIPFNFSEQEFLVNILYSDNWVETGALIARANELPEDIDKEKLYAKLLMDNLYIKEVNYGLTMEGDILIHAETSTESLGFENFKTEFGSVIYGIKNYVENILPEFPSLKNADHKSVWNINPV